MSGLDENKTSCRRCSHFRVCHRFQGDDTLRLQIYRLVDILRPKTELSDEETGKSLRIQFLQFSLQNVSILRRPMPDVLF